MRQVSETTSKYTVFPALILVYTVIVTDQRKRNTLVNLGLVNLGLVNLGLVNLGFSWGVHESTYPTCDVMPLRQYMYSVPIRTAYNGYMYNG